MVKLSNKETAMEGAYSVSGPDNISGFSVTGQAVILFELLFLFFLTWSYSVKNYLWMMGFIESSAIINNNI